METLCNFPKPLWLFRSEARSKSGIAEHVLLATLPTAFLSLSTSTTANGSDGIGTRSKTHPRDFSRPHLRH